MSKLIPYAPLGDALQGIPSQPPIRAYVVKGWFVLALFFGVFGIWATIAPLVSAAIAPGEVKVDSHRKTVQTFDGGIVREILVHEGEAVKRGQVLVRLDSVDAGADLEATRAQVGALEAQIAANREQLPTMEEQLRDMQSLYEKGFSRKPQILELEREVSKLKGDIASDESRLLALREQEHKAEARLARGNLTAPQDGVIMNLRVHTPGGVIQPGAEILDLVPTPAKLVIEVKIRPNDISVVRPGLPATIRFVAYKQRTTPTVDGRVTVVSADAMTEERTGIAYFSATIEVNTDELARAANVKLYPGMPVEAAITTGKRTMLTFLLQPFMDSFAHAFNEQ